MKKRRLINSHTVFISTLIVGFTIALIIYLVGLRSHSTLYHNSLATTTILTSVFFVFTFIGLYNGWKLKDTLGDMSAHFSKLSRPKHNGTDVSVIEGIGNLELGEGIEGCIIGIVLWIVVGFFGTIILWLIGAFFWGIILFLAGLLYWIIFRAYRLILKRSIVCKGNFVKSFRIALVYSLMYTCWIYAIIYLVHHFN